MSAESKIEWTDLTWNPVTGCTKVSAGCKNCYAERVAVRLWGKQYQPVAIGPTLPDGGPTAWRDREFTDVLTHAERLDQPLRWKKPRKVFVNSMSDLFHEDVPDAFIDQVFAVMALAERHTFQVLTKRADRMRDYMVRLDRDMRLHTTTFPRWRSDAEAILCARKDSTTMVTSAWPLPNVWLGVSVENQHFAAERIPMLLQTPAAVRFISAEPLLGPVDVIGVVRRVATPTPYNIPNNLHWVIVGGESGAGARPFDVAWARSIVERCKASGVACFVKQLGAHIVTRNDDGFEGDTPKGWPIDTEYEGNIHGHREDYQGAPVRVHLNSRAGGDMNEWPADLRVREFPRERIL